MRSQNMRSGILLAAAVFFALHAGAAFAGDRGDVISVRPQHRAIELSWNDTEDTLSGSVTPDLPREGQPLTVTVMVASFYGPPFDGPVTIALRPEGAQGSAQTVTVAPEHGTWSATFVPKSAGPHLVDISFRTTRLKVLHANIRVEPAKLPRSVAWGLGGMVVLLAVLFGGLRQWRRPNDRSPRAAA
ncbi:MAG: hypothetical protein IRZ16_21100 [Myxococcaceae bacterium]|nr:hypothetical protein [Myxococcaceae bacterium]